ncbi:hypothetical protein [Nocardia sp. CA-290969]|uniref:hypothetical protein n=1 Tax=Nocardia sp. CA-290969 TaxID=3239986 RepID=UPI003D93AC1D
MTAQFLQLSDGLGSARFEEVLDGLTGRTRVAIQAEYGTYGPDDLRNLRAFLDAEIKRMEDSPWR